MEILKFPDPRLLKRCQKVTEFGPELKVLLDSMYETMVAANGVGLAANQVGLDLCMFVMRSEHDGGRLNVVNPAILEYSRAIENLREGCLSAPGEFVTTGIRPAWVKIEFQDETGQVRQMVLTGIDSVCACHEMDHLLGIAFMQSKKIPKKVRREICRRWGLKE